MDHRQIATEAAEWFFRLEEDPEPQGNAEFAAWLKRSPRHMGEFLFATAAYKLVRSGDPGRLIAIDENSKADRDNIVALDEKEPRPTPRRESTSRWMKWSLAAAVLLSLGIFSWQFMQPGGSGTNVYRTQTGEQRSFKLDDGSVLYLNTQSQARVVYSTSAREVRLADGEALFTVAHDSRRPFSVRAGDTLIQAVGTQFNVYRRKDATTVSVIEGRVKVSEDDSASTLLVAGEEARVSDDKRISKRLVRDLTPAIAWRQRRLVFEATPLSDVAREFNRYNRSQIRIEGEPAAVLQITGVFNADEPQALVSFLAQNPALDIATANGAILIRSAANGP